MEAPLIDWTSRETHVLLNPRLPANERAEIEALIAAAPRLAAHVWIATSGSSGQWKVTALSKEAILAAAAAVNRHLGVVRGDAWACVLPTFHVGGLGIHARAFLTSSPVVTLAWDPRQFAAQDVAFSALVPAQVRDLVDARLEAPRALRAIVVGGGTLDPALYDEARTLGWPLLPSYGMTECCSQVATATPALPELVILDHLEVEERGGVLAIRGASLLTGYATAEGFVDPKVDGWFVTEDFGVVVRQAAGAGRRLRVEGRRGDFVKIGGESVDLARLDRILNGLSRDAALVAVPDERLGSVLHLAATVEPGPVAAAFNERVLPYERVRAVHRVPSIPRSPLGKLLRGRLLEMVRR